MNEEQLRHKDENAASDSVSVHTLVISTGFGSMLVPSVMVAEVLPVPAVHDAGSPRPWVFGRINWRGLSVPIISLERLMSNVDMDRNQYTRVVVFHPLPGRRRDDYFGILTSRDARSMLVSENLEAHALPKDVSGRYVASAVEVRGQVSVIPDIDALATAIY